jgi:hypothetical protein
VGDVKYQPTATANVRIGSEREVENVAGIGQANATAVMKNVHQPYK